MNTTTTEDQPPHMCVHECVFMCGCVGVHGCVCVWVRVYMVVYVCVCYCAHKYVACTWMCTYGRVYVWVRLRHCVCA